jgi:hypothetical protein
MCEISNVRGVGFGAEVRCLSRYSEMQSEEVVREGVIKIDVGGLLWKWFSIYILGAVSHHLAAWYT